MTYAIPSNVVDFSFSEPPYIVETSDTIDFLFDSRPVFQYSTPPSRIKAYASHWQVGSRKSSVLISAYSDSIALNISHAQASNKASVIDIAAMSLLWGAVAEKEIIIGFSFDQSEEKEDSKVINWSHTRTEDSERIISWDNSISPNDKYRLSEWQKTDIQDREHRESITSVGLYINKEKQSKGYLHPQQPLNFTFRNELYQPVEHSDVFFRLGEFDPVISATPLDVGKRSPYRSNQHKDEVKVIPWGFGQKIRDEEITGSYGGEKTPDIVEKPEPEQPDIRENYLLMNTITTVVLPDRIPIELPSLEISLDIDSFSWSFTGQLIGATNIALVEPDQNGPKQIEVNINGWKWLFIVERYSTDRRFGNERYTIYGSSRTQLLAAPYAPMRSKSNNSDLNAKQAITEELANTGFTATYSDLNDYSTPDWIMPSGSFSYQNQTAMQVVAKIAGTAGSVVIPSRETDQLNIQPRYPASPWSWNTTTMDRIVPASMVISLSASWRPEQIYNAVYVSGTNAGVAVNVKRQGTNGNNPAPDILEDWLTETQVNTERGRNELSKGGNQSITTIELPLTDTNTAPGLIEPGMLVEVQDITGDWQGLCLSTSITANGAGSVLQSIELERHY